MKALLFLVFGALAFWGGWTYYPNLKEAAEKAKAAHAAELARIAGKERSKLLMEGKIDPVTGRGRAAEMFAALGKKPEDGEVKAGGPMPPPPPLPGAGAGAAGSGVATAPAVPASKDEMEVRYPMPQFKGIEEITKEWTSVPSRAFPRKVKTKVAVMFDVAAGKVELPAGSDARAVAMTQGMLILMKEGDDTARTMVPLANTDLKETLTSLYEKFKEYKRNTVIKQREHARTVKANANGATEDQMKLAGPKPKQDGGGVVGLMLDSVRASKFTELKESAITSWGEVNFEMIDGKPYWTGTVQCMVENAIFGPQPTEVMALIRNDKVEKWIYSGSREDVQ